MRQVAFRHKIRRATEWYYSFLPKFNLCEDFHISPKTKLGLSSSSFLFPPNVKVYVLDLSVFNCYDRKVLFDMTYVSQLEK
jgi:hypothetical protein